MSLHEVLVPALQAAFPGRGLRVPDGPGPVAAFPPACAEVGEVLVFATGLEAVVAIEHVTHHHVDLLDPDLDEDEQAQRVVAEVVDFLRDLFDDRVFLWAIDQGRGGGGWCRPYDGAVVADIPAGADLFVWSRRLPEAG